MGYYLQAIIGNQADLRLGASNVQHAHIVPLPQGLGMIPLTDELFATLGGGEVERFEKLSPSVEEWVRKLSPSTKIAYIEAEYFGGTGVQSAVVWLNDARVFGPRHSQEAINETLRFLGIRVDQARDEFDTVGLGRHRSTEGWKS